MKERRQTACKGGQINTLLETWCEFLKNQAHHHKILNSTSEMKQTLYSTHLDTSVRYRISICSMLAGFLPQQMFDRQQDVLKVWWYTDAEKVIMVSVEALREQTVQRESQQEGFSWVQPGCIIYHCKHNMILHILKVDKESNTTGVTETIAFKTSGSQRWKADSIRRPAVMTMNIHTWQLIKDAGVGASSKIPAAAPRQSAEWNESPLSDGRN